DPALVLSCARSVLADGGSLIILVPQSPWLFGTLDRALGHRRRFSLRQMVALLKENGFSVQRSYQLNKVGMPAWWIFSKVLGRRHINKVFLKIFDKTVWLWRRIDGLLPWKGLSVVIIAKKS
ncbi:MAG: glycosyltransferase, partial [Bryobacteraceae bacterium]